MLNQLHNYSHTKNPLIHDDANVTMGAIAEVMDYLISADELLETHISDERQIFQFTNARIVLIKLIRDASFYEANRIEISYKKVQS